MTKSLSPINNNSFGAILHLSGAQLLKLYALACFPLFNGSIPLLRLSNSVAAGSLHTAIKRLPVSAPLGRHKVCLKRG